MTIERPMFPPRAEPADCRPADRLASLRLTGPEQATIAALLGFLACGLACGSSLEEMEAIVFEELERARKLAAKSERRQFWIAGSHLVSAPALTFGDAT